MKVGILLGRGIEGCGVTKMAIEQAKWYNKNGHEAIIIANRDKTWPRKKTHDFAGIEVYHEKFKEVLPIKKVAKYYEASKEFKKIQTQRKTHHSNPGQRNR